MIWPMTARPRNAFFSVQVSRRRVLAGLAGAFVGANSLQAHDFPHADIHVGHPWMMPLPTPSIHGEVYFAIVNRGARADRLVGAETTIAGRIRFVEQAAGSPPRVVSAFELPPGRPLGMRPGGRHLRLEWAVRALDAGQRIALTLHFERASSLVIEVVVEPAPVH